MHVNRRLLYWGVFLISAGAVLLVAQTAAVDDAAIARALALWPVLVIALGVGLLMRRTRFNMAGGLLAAAMPGLLLGGLVVATPRIAPECGESRPVGMEAHRGTFGGAASVDLVLACGDVSVTTAPGNAWQLETNSSRGAGARVDASASRLSIASAERERMFDFFRGPDAWQLSLPSATTLDLAAEVNAGNGQFDLAGTRLGGLRLAVNAGAAQVDLAGATVARLSARVNAASVSVNLPETADFDADLEVNAGALKVCAPSGLGLRIHDQAVLGSTTYTGLVRVGDAWESPAFSIASHHADVTISVNVGSVDINPIGGCR